jgi:antitoxin component YwqK of YwqJK toxin-antitoxin module
MRHSVTHGSTATDKALPYKVRDQAATFLFGSFSFERKEKEQPLMFISFIAIPNEELIGTKLKRLLRASQCDAWRRPDNAPAHRNDISVYYIYHMKPKLLALFLLISAGVNAQTKTVKHRDGDRGLVEAYTVQKSDPTTREGKTKISAMNNPSLPIVEGYYHNNQRDSLWKYYSGKQLVAEGNYKAGKKVGAWMGFSPDGLRLRYNYTGNELLFYKPASADTSTTFKVIGNGADTLLDRLPISFNGMNTVLFTLSRNIRYPISAIKENRQGGALLTFTIDENGIAGNYAVKNSPGVDTEILKAIKLSEGDWLPGMVNGKLVAVQCEIPILFVINPPEDATFKGYEVIVAVSNGMR